MIDTHQYAHEIILLDTYYYETVNCKNVVPSVELDIKYTHSNIVFKKLLHIQISRCNACNMFRFQALIYIPSGIGLSTQRSNEIEQLRKRLTYREVPSRLHSWKCLNGFCRVSSNLSKLFNLLFMLRGKSVHHIIYICANLYTYMFPFI